MEISAFNPILLTKDAQTMTELFEALGFEHKHKKTGINDEDITSYDMKNPDGFRVDVTQIDQIPQDMLSIRMTVRGFDEAYDILTAHGFTNAQGGKITDTGTSRATLMVSPSGFSISLSEHIKNK